MPIHLRENQYRGVNAHLHSFLQHEPGGWESFHVEHVQDLRRAIIRQLPPGYFVLSEKSLQISEFSPTMGYERTTRSKPDVTVYRTPPITGQSPVPVVISDLPTESIPIIETLSDTDLLGSVMIYQQASDNRLIPVTRIELLSPANKPPGSHHPQYLVKRDETLTAGINLVEIDYLHETRPAVQRLPSYPDREPNAYPYVILVNNPHPTLEQGYTAIYGFRVDEPVPRITVPLVGQDAIALDLGKLYQETFSTNPYYGLIAVDYAQEPVQMETYSPADQERIRERMKAVAQTQGQSQ